MAEKLVLDASVAAKWYLREENLVEAAEHYFILFSEGEIEFHAPRLIFYEMGHVLTKAQRKPRGRIDIEQSEKAFEHFCQLPIKIHVFSNDQLQKSLSLANSLNRSFYDSCYLLLAIELKSPWLTSDMRFRGVFPQGFPSELVLPLESLKV